jgi:hypothetical protein
MALQDAVKSLGETGPTKAEILGATSHELLPQGEALAKEAWAHPVDAALSAGKTILGSAVIGTAVGYLVPARGPAAALVAAGFMAPMVIGAYKRLDEAQAETQKGASLDSVSKALARDSVEGGTNFILNMAGGMGGTEFGVRLATSKSLGMPGQFVQRSIMSGENLVLNSISKPVVPLDGAAKPLISLPTGKITSLSGEAAPQGMLNISTEKPITVLGRDAAMQKTTPLVEKTGLAARLDQHRIASLNISRDLSGGTGDGQSKMYFGSLHGHSHYSDGLGDPKDLFAKAAEEGQDVTTITDHNHLAARGGVSPDDPRTKDEADVPIIAGNPIEYSQTFADAAATTTPTHLSLVGTEIGTIGKVGGGAGGGEGGDGGGSTGGGHGGGKGGGKGGGRGGHETDQGGPVPGGTPSEGLVGKNVPDTDTGTGTGAHDHDHEDLEHHTHGMMNPERIGEHNPGNKPFDLAAALADANAAAHLGGVNHIGLLEVPTFFETIRTPGKGLTASLMRSFGVEPAPVVSAPDVVKINDGDYRSLVDHLDKLKATDGGSPIITLNHPRYMADENPNVPAASRGRDYGQKSFANQQEWLDRFATPYVRQVELIKGGALNPNPVDKVPPGMLDPTSFAGYIDKGVHASPAFGRDFHFGDPVGNPGATGIFAKSLDKGDVLNALRERRTIATTSSKNLSGVLTANDGIMMGSILDHSVTPSLSLKMRIDGVVDPNASYTVQLLGDENIGDGELAKVLQTKNVKGSDLLASNQTVAFDPVTGTTGQNSAYYVEVSRLDPTSNNTDRMWTAPIWLENLAGTKHTMISRLLNGQLNPFQSTIPTTPPIVR